MGQQSLFLTFFGSTKILNFMFVKRNPHKINTACKSLFHGCNFPVCELKDWNDMASPVAAPDTVQGISRKIKSIVPTGPN